MGNYGLALGGTRKGEKEENEEGQHFEYKKKGEEGLFANGAILVTRGAFSFGQFQLKKKKQSYVYYV